MEFEWDPAKAKANFADHGVAFEDAARVFLDPGRVEDLDDRFDYGEDRYYCIGMVEEVVLFVAFTMRGDLYRIISARRATLSERRRYASI